MSDGDYKYWAFISYSHQDKSWGDWLHKILENYRVPGRLAGRASRDGQVPKRLYPIFRDREELPSSADLGNNISDALRRSRYLVVICSPHAAPSRWVNEEIKAFKKLGREDRILALIVDGEPNASDKPDSGLLECFPVALRHRLGTDGEPSGERVEPIAADARTGKDGRASAALKLIAGLLGVGYDELKQRERQRRLQRRIQWSVAGLLLVALAASGWRWQAGRALAASYAEQGREALLQDKPLEAGLYLAEAYRRGQVSADVQLMLDKAVEPLRSRHTELPVTLPTEDMPYSADGRYLLAYAKDQTLILDGDSGQRVAVLDQPPQFHPQAWSFDHDGKRVAMLAQDGSAYVFDAASGKLLQSLPEHRRAEDAFSSITFDPSGTRLLALESPLDPGPQAPHLLTLYRLEDGRRVEFDTRNAASFESLESANFSPDGGLVYADGANSTYVWSATDGRFLYTLNPPFQSYETRSYFTGFTPDGRYLERWFDDSVRLWEARTGAYAGSFLMDIHFPTGPRIGPEVSRDGRRMLLEVAGNKLEARDTVNGKLVGTAEYSGTDFPVTDFDGRVMALRTDAGFIELRDMETATRLTRFYVGSARNVWSPRLSPGRDRILTTDFKNHASLWSFPASSSLRRQWSFDRTVTSLALSRDGRRLFVGLESGGGRVLDAAGGQTLAEFKLPATNPEAIIEARFVADGRSLVLASGETGAAAHLWIWTPGASGAPKVLDESPDFVASSKVPRDADAHLDISADDRRLLAANAALRLWSPDGGALQVLDAVADYSRVAALSPDGKQVASFSDKHGLLLYSIADGSSNRIPAPAHKPLLCAYTDSGRSILLVYADGSAELRDSKDGRRLEDFKPVDHSLARADLVLNPERTQLAVIDKAGGTLWDLRSGRLDARFESPAGPLSMLAFAGDDGWLVGVTEDGTLETWDSHDGRQLWSQDNARAATADNRVTVSADAGFAASSSGSYHVQLWSLRAPSFDFAEVEALLACRSPWQLKDGKLVTVTPDSKACPP